MIARRHGIKRNITVCMLVRMEREKKTLVIEYKGEDHRVMSLRTRGGLTGGGYMRGAGQPSLYDTQHLVNRTPHRSSNLASGSSHSSITQQNFYALLRMMHAHIQSCSIIRNIFGLYHWFLAQSS